MGAGSCCAAMLTPMNLTVMHRRAAIKTLAGLASAASTAHLARASEPFRLAYFETYSPLSFVDKGHLTGILVDVLDEVIGRMGLPRVHSGFPWARAQLLVKNGEQDAICTIATPERLEYAQAADEPVVTAFNCIFVRKDHPKLAQLAQVTSLDELRAMKLGVLSYAANGWAKAKLTGFDVMWGSDFGSSLKMLVAGRGDLMVENALTMQYSLARTPGGDAIRMLPNRFDEAQFQLLVSKHSPHLSRLPEFSRLLAQFKRAPAYGEIFQRYGVKI